MADIQAMNQPAPKKGSPVKIILIIVAIVGVMGVICVGGCVMFGMWGLGQAGQMTVNQFKDHPDFQQHIGANAKASFNMTRTGQEGQGPANQGTIVYDVTGDNGSGELIVKPKGQGSQEFEKAILKTGAGEFDLTK